MDSNYVLLWNVIDRTFDTTTQQSVVDASNWHGYPKDPIDPNPIKKTGGITAYSPYWNNFKPQYPLGGRLTSRSNGGGYSSLSNYNVIP